MSQLDRLESQSMSGVPMRRKVFAPVSAPSLSSMPTPPQDNAASPTTTEIFAQLANLLATSNEKLASTIGTALTSRQEEIAPQRKAMTLDFTFGADGSVTGATSTDGVSAGHIAFTRNHSQQIEALTFSSAGRSWKFAVTRAAGKLTVSTSPN